MTTVTLAQVAERAGVSTATVSMVLRNRGRISQATRDRVLKALDDTGYVYNQTAANLRNRSSNQVGLLLHDITNPFYGEMTAGLSHEMERHDLLLFLANSEESGERQQKFVDSLMRNSACGMVLCAARETPSSFFDALKRRNIPAIMVVRPLSDPDFDFVGTDNFLGTQMATTHLLKMGHQNIAFIGGSPSSGTRRSALAVLPARCWKAVFLRIHTGSSPLRQARLMAPKWRNRCYRNIRKLPPPFAIRILSLWE